MAFYRDTENHVYNAEDCLGRGATGDVYLGINKLTGEKRALKMFDPRYTAQIAREVDALLKLQHPNITKFYQIEKDYMTKKSVLVMELCEKGNLLELLREPQNNLGLSEEEFVHFFGHLVSGMKHLRQQGFSHRDIKPGNILVCVDPDGSLVYKLSDFGTAKPLNDGDFFQSLVGTEEYLHPDIFRAAFIDNRRQREFNISADLWSLGATLFHACTGRVPFQPYSGRMDKATMYNMISKKESGVISGVQSNQGGDIEWSRELPNTCRYSKYLKDVLTEMLVRLLECHGYRMWTFDGFFVEADELLHKRQIHVFTTFDFRQSYIYINPKASVEEFKVAVQEQTYSQSSKHHIDYRGHNIMIFGNRQDKSCDTFLVSDIPVTSCDSPLVVSDAECKQCVYVQTDAFFWMQYAKELALDFRGESSSHQIEEDYRVAKRMCMIMSKLSSIVSQTNCSVALANEAMLSCRCELQNRLEKICSERKYLRHRFDDVDTLIQKDKKSVAEEFTTVSVNGDIVEDDRTKVRNKLSECSAFEDFTKKLHQERSSILDEKSTEDLRKMTKQALRLYEESESLLGKFVERRKKPMLKYHEQQFQVFDRLTMKKLYNDVLFIAEKARDISNELNIFYVAWNNKTIKQILMKLCRNEVLSTPINSVVCHLDLPKGCSSMSKRSHKVAFFDKFVNARIFRHRVSYIEVCNTYEEELDWIRGSITEIVQNMKGIHDPPLPSITQRKLAYDVKKRVNSILATEISESKSLLQESRLQIESLSSLMADLPTLQDSVTEDLPTLKPAGFDDT